MRMQRGPSTAIWGLVAQLAMCGNLACSTSAQDLPGSNGPRVENVAAAPDGIKVLWVAVLSDLSAAGVSDAPRAADREKSLPQSFPTGTKELYFLVDVAGSLPSGTKIGIGAVCKAGPVEFPDFASVMTASNGVETRLLLRRGPKSGAFPDGPCQGTLSVNGQAVAKLNWTMGQ